MKKLPVFMILTLLSVVLSGCLTADLWGDGNDFISFSPGTVSQQRESNQEVEKDQILGFALLTVPDTKAQKLIIVGKKFAYLSNDVNTAHQILDSALDVKHIRLASSQAPVEDLYFTINEDLKSVENGLPFRTAFNFVYDKDPAQLSVAEQQALKALMFHERQMLIATKENKQQTITRYVKNTNMEGQIVGLNNELKQLQFEQFSKSYTIHIHQFSTHKQINFKRLFAKIAVTPLTLVGDLVILPIGYTVHKAGSAMGAFQ